MLVYWSLNKFIRISFLLCIMCLTIIGNSYILIELTFRRQRPRTRLHLFIYHLAIGDLAICFCTMTSELFLLIYDQEWILGNFACKLTLYIQVVTIASTTFIQVAMTYDRYEAVYCPLRRTHSFFRIQRMILFCWLSSFLVAIPQLFIFEQSLIPTSQSIKYRCASTGYSAEWQRYVYFTVFSSYVLFIPVICMTVWFIRIIHIINLSTRIWNKNHEDQTLTTLSLTSPTKIRTVKLAMTIIIVFVVCWTPYIVITLVEIYSNGRFRTPSWLDGTLQMICFCQSCFNPFIYLVFNQKRRYSSTLIRAAASTYSNNKFDRQQRGSRRERGGSIANYFSDRSRKDYY